MSQFPPVSVVVPTYHEAENLPDLIRRLDAVRTADSLDMELLVMDDNSRDGTEEALAALNVPWVRLVVRTANRGLSAAVLDGFALAGKDVAVVMDADLSHPPEAIPEMLRRIGAGADFVLGSRYAAGGTTQQDWGFARRLNSRGATLLARPFTSVRDPMSGFFAFRRAALRADTSLNPVGYKIGLELIVKGGFTRIEEMPIHFSARQRGESKLSLRQQMLYLRHLRRLADYKYGDLSHFAQFALVGASGVAVNLAVLTLLWQGGMPLKAAVAVAIIAAMCSNFILNRRITFSYARGRSLWKQFAGFTAGSSVGIVVNYLVTLGLLARFPALMEAPQLASLAGILAGLAFNYTFSRYLVFHKRG